MTKIDLDENVTVTLCGEKQTISIKANHEQFLSFKNKMIEHYGNVPYEVLEYIYYQHLDLKRKNALDIVEGLRSDILKKLTETEPHETMNLKNSNFMQMLD